MHLFYRHYFEIVNLYIMQLIRYLWCDKYQAQDSSGTTGFVLAGNVDVLAWRSKLTYKIGCLLLCLQLKCKLPVIGSWEEWIRCVLWRSAPQRGWQVSSLFAKTATLAAPSLPTSPSAVWWAGPPDHTRRCKLIVLRWTTLGLDWPSGEAGLLPVSQCGQWAAGTTPPRLGGTVAQW